MLLVYFSLYSIVLLLDEHGRNCPENDYRSEDSESWTSLTRVIRLAVGGRPIRSG